MAVAETVPVAQEADLCFVETPFEHYGRMVEWRFKLPETLHKNLLSPRAVKGCRTKLENPNTGSYFHFQDEDRCWLGGNRDDLLLKIGVEEHAGVFKPMLFTTWLKQLRQQKMEQNDKAAAEIVDALSEMKFDGEFLVSTDMMGRSKAASGWTPQKSRLLTKPRIVAKQVGRGQVRVKLDLFDGDELVASEVLKSHPNCHLQNNDITKFGSITLFCQPPKKIIERHYVQHGPLPETLNSCRADVKLISEAMTVGEKAVMKDDSRPIMQKVLLRSGDDCLTVAATDTYRLLKVTVPAPGAVAGSDLSVSPFALKVALKGLKGEITVAWDSSRLYFSDDNVTAVSVPYTQEKFVNINHVWPDENKPAVEARLLASDLVEGLTLMGIVGKEDANRVVLSLGYGQAKLSAGGIHSMGGEMSGSYLISNQADYCWQDAKIAFNFRYLMDFVDRVKKSGGKKSDPELTLKMWGQEKAMLWQGGGMEYLLMPMQLD